MWGTNNKDVDWWGSSEALTALSIVFRTSPRREKQWAVDTEAYNVVSLFAYWDKAVPKDKINL